ncbi:hypothetical protein HanXRQr2_Chr12g0538421 [Helianthus annuus]|uniref:Uncharacterized protein n=1 Tax=Helianthus annuus TaxID=4232 RepID=A0A9K3MVS6_HELAN|nr:hypothetical protein HanXRQr2_Chr12g0538421 [Helianthus annuus]KAJ0862440.1 hypothetical protein HanPSC8_Chr12g0518241 [Helianthus annuus]
MVSFSKSPGLVGFFNTLVVENIANFINRLMSKLRLQHKENSFFIPYISKHEP